MKAHTNDFKTEIAQIGRQITCLISYEDNGNTIELGDEILNSIALHYKGDILKSVMKQLDIDSNQDIPIGTIINCQIGLYVNGNYEYLDYGNYIVYSSEKQEDLISYKITCYDKMLLSMVDYEDMEIQYPITIRNYINVICTQLGITFGSINDTFANYDKQIVSELYLDSGGNKLGYTYRDVLDELAQVTASTICINDNDELEIRYITATNDIVDEDYLKDTNVDFGEKYGPINSVVLSRSAETDNVVLKDDSSIAQNGLCEIKIIDNQIMNWNDRADYLPDIFSKLSGLEYYINKYSSTGIIYYDICDRYTVQIGENYYSCVMFNDEINLEQGLSENIYTNIPKISETDYTKSDSTDRKINQTYLIVDKQNQTIEGVVSRVDEQDTQIATIRLQYNELLSRISDIADITTSGESSYASVNLTDVNASQPIDIKIHPILENISYDYPHNDYPQIDYCKSRTLRFTNTDTNEVFDWVIPTDLWYYDSTTYDELELSYGDGTNSTVTVTRRCQINADNSVSVLATPTTETYTYPLWLILTDGDYTINLIDNNTGYLFVQLMAKNIYTTQFYTKAETNTLINQTASSIDLSVNNKLSNYSTTQQMNSAISLSASEINSTVATKVGNNEIISKINQSSEQVSINANKLNLTGYITATDLSTSGSTNINGDNISTGVIKSQNYVANTSGTKLDLSNGVIDSKNFKLASNGDVTFKGTINGGAISVSGDYGEDDPYLLVKDSEATGVKEVRAWSSYLVAYDYTMSPDGEDATIRTESSSGYAELHDMECNAFAFNNISLAERKENFEKLENALDIIKQTDIYKYNYKNEQRKKKHIGLVIGDKYNYSNELTNEKNDSVDLYSMIGVCLQAIKEQQEEIEALKNKLKESDK